MTPTCRRDQAIAVQHRSARALHLDLGLSPWCCEVHQVASSRIRCIKRPGVTAPLSAMAVAASPRMTCQYSTVVSGGEKLSEAAESVGCLEVKVRQLRGSRRVRQRAADEAGGALRKVRQAVRIGGLSERAAARRSGSTPERISVPGLPAEASRWCRRSSIHSSQSSIAFWPTTNAGQRSSS